MASMAATSRPLVGAAATNTRGRADSSRARMALWMFPPDRRLVGIAQRTPRMSNCFSRLRARSSTARFDTSGPFDSGGWR